MSSRLVAFAAATRDALLAQLRKCASLDEARPAPPSAAGEGAHRLAILADSTGDFEALRARVIEALADPGERRHLAIHGTAFYGRIDPADVGRTVCLFPGFGVQQTTLLDDLSRHSAVVNAWSDALGAQLQDREDEPVSPQTGTPRSPTRLDAALLNDLAVWVWLRDLGLRPDALVGHSFGEFAMLLAAGIVDDCGTLVDTLKAVDANATSDSRTNRLGMVALSAASRPILETFLRATPPRVFVSLDNCPQQVVVWGDDEVLGDLVRAVEAQRQVAFRLADLGQPVHTPLFPVSRAELQAAFERLPLRAPVIRAFSAATLEQFPDDAEAIREVLVEQWHRPVRFRELLARLHGDGARTFVEVGAGDRLSGFVRDTLRGTGVSTIPTNVEGRDVVRQLRVAAAQLFVRGHDLDLARADSPQHDRPIVVAATTLRDSDGRDGPRTPSIPGAAVERRVADEVALLLDTTTDLIDVECGLFDLGLGSLDCVTLVDRLGAALDLSLPQTLAFDHPTVRRLAKAVADVRAGTSPAPRLSTRTTGTAPSGGIAVIGIGCRFPGAMDSPAAFWEGLDAGRDVVGSAPGGRWAPDLDAAIAAAGPAARYGAYLEDISGFDPGFFGISPREALTLDPQQRLLLEVTWEALEHAAIDAHALAGSRTGVFVGISNNDYASRLSVQERLAIGGYLGTGNTASTAAGRISFVLGLRGPALAVDTACSSSLTAVHLACQSLVNGECDTAVAGGVNLIVNPETTIFLCRAQALSPTGRCRTFDARADGYVRGEGCGIIVLKRLDAALRDGDRVIGVIRGTAVNHDGRTSGLTVPNGLAQEAVIREALACAGCEPADVSYVEAHGTGTPLGDPIEVQALGRAFAANGTSPGVRLGALKTNIGHLEAAAGVAGLIKVLLQLSHRRLVPSLHLRAPNPLLGWPGIADAVVTTAGPWHARQPLRAGVSAFGISGTNVHVVVEEGPEPGAASATAEGRACLFTVSGHSESAARAVAARLARHLEGQPALDLSAVARALTQGRAHLAWRAALVAGDAAALLAGLRRIASGEAPVHQVRRSGQLTDLGADADEHPDLAALARRYEQGGPIDWSAQAGMGAGPRADLPTYPFERERFWVDAQSAGPAPVAAEPPSDSVEAAGDDTEPRLWRARLAAAADAERRQMVQDYLRGVIGTILGVPAGRPVDEERPLVVLGLDSLMSVQVSIAVTTDLGIALEPEDVEGEASVSTITALIEERLGAAPAATPVGNASEAAGAERSLTAPVSFGQRALWFLWRLAPTSTAYHQSMPLRIGHGGMGRWRRAAESVVRRHPMLRTRFSLTADGLVQTVSPAATVPWSEGDARGLTAEELTTAMTEAHEAPFDLDRDPPIRFHWFALGDEQALLLVTMHHVACDAWSLEVLRRDLARAAEQAAPAELPALSHTYAEFVEWQAAQVSGTNGEALWAFWRDRLAPPVPRLDLPLDHPRPAVQSFRGASVSVAISPSLASSVRDYAAQQHVTPFVVWLAAYVAVLARWSGQRDLVVGAPTSGRSDARFAEVVGYFVDPVVLRATVPPRVSGADLVGGVQSVVRDALAHGQMPFPLIVERLKVDRDPSRSPLFDVTFNFHSRRAVAHLARGEGAVAPDVAALPQADGKFDLTLTVIDDEDAAEVALGFNADLFERATIARVGTWLPSVLDAVTGHPQDAIDDLVLEAESPGLAPVCSGRRTDTRTLRPVHLQILDGAARHPEATAVVARDGTLSYGELDRRSAEVARDLVRCGAGPDMPVASSTDRTTDAVVGMIGILRAGAAFVPLDSSLPGAVQAGMRRDVGAWLTVAGGRVVRVSHAAGTAPSHTPRETRGEDLAYVIFTSGSTGRPKGVGIEHGALANYVASIVHDLEIVPGSRHACVSTLSADLGHTVIFPALATGGELHLLDEDTATDRQRFAAYLRDHAIDYLKIVPSHLGALIDVGHRVLPRRAVVLGGESTSPRWLDTVRDDTDCRFFNHYGPTETTVGVLTYAVPPRGAIEGSRLPLQRAVDNVDVWLLDEAGHSASTGATGEIHVSGPCLARGYIGDEARTREHFVQIAGIGRAYRTGDLARRRGDGMLEVIGRADRQVKVRGYRVEPGHIEAQLLECPLVRRAVVMPTEEAPPVTSLTAWVVPAANDAPADVADTMRQWLEARVPSHMVPGRFVVVGQLPLTSNGKADLAALRALSPAAPPPSVSSAPRDVIEWTLQRLWTRVLNAPGASMTDNFFRVGGHSLLAVHLASLVEEELGVRLPLATFFTHPTLEDLARAVREAGSSGITSQRLVPLRRLGTRTPLVCFPGAGGSPLYFRALVAALPPEQPVWAAQAVGLTDLASRSDDIPTQAAAYAAAIRESLPGATHVCLAGHSFGALMAYAVAQLLQGHGVTVSWLGALDNAMPDGEVDEAVSTRDERGWLRHIAIRLERLYGIDLGGGTAEELQTSAGMARALLTAGVLPPSTPPEAFARYVELYRAHAIAAAAYRPSPPPLTIPVTVFRAALEDAALEHERRPGDEAMGWTRCTTGPVDVVRVAGTHITMLNPPHVDGLAAAMSAAMSQVANGVGCEARS